MKHENSHFIFSNIIGCFVFDEKFNLVEEILFNKSDDPILIYHELEKKHSAIPPDPSFEKHILSFLRHANYFPSFYKSNLSVTKNDLRNSVGPDLLIVQSISSIDETTKLINTLAKRLREWYSFYNPEFSRSISDNVKFAELVNSKSRDELYLELQVVKSDCMGADLSEEDLVPIHKLASLITDMNKYKVEQSLYLESVMKSHCPNMVAITGPLIGARLLAKAGSLKKLVDMPSSTIQLLGAEKALFRHMCSGARPPKFGFLHEHPFVLRAKRDAQGKAARLLADKINIAIKIDYFKGEFIGDKLYKEIEGKLR